MKSTKEIFAIATFGTLDQIMECLKSNEDFDVNSKNSKEGKTILHLIASRECDIDKSVKNLEQLMSDLFILLKKRNMNFNQLSDKRTVALHHAISHNNPNIVKLLLPLTDTNTLLAPDDHTFLHQAITTGNQEIVRTVLEYDIKTMPNSSRDSKIVMLFATDKQNRTPMALVRHKKNNNILLLMTSCLTNNNLVPDNNPIDHIKKNNLDILKFNLAIGEDPNTKDKDGNTLLHHAIGSRHQKEFIELMLSYNVDLEAKSNRGSTPLDRAAAITYDENSIKILLNAGANIKCKNNAGNTIVHTACYNIFAGHKILQNLFQDGKITVEDFKIQNKKFQFPLDIAVQKQNDKTTRKLLQLGSPIPSDLKNNDSQTDGNEKPKIKRAFEGENEDTQQSSKKPCFGNQNSSYNFFSHSEKSTKVSMFNQKQNNEMNDSELQKLVYQQEETMNNLREQLSMYQQEIIRLSNESNLPITPAVQEKFELTDEEIYQP